jgi:hypothetical protein
MFPASSLKGGKIVGLSIQMKSIFYQEIQNG